MTPWVTGYADYAVANRAPTPAELFCAGPQNARSLANFFVGDPSLQQVVAHTIEAGVCGSLPRIAGGTLTYNLGLFRSTLANDIAPVGGVRVTF